MKGYKWEETNDYPKSITYGFKIAEPKKERSRPVWSCGINAFLEEGSFDSFRSSTREEIYKMMSKNDWFVDFDVKSMYDHFLLKSEIRNYFQFHTKDKKNGRLRLLPMGFGPSALVAQSSTFKLLNFEKSSESASCIDNMGLANKSKYKLIEEALRLVDRAAEVNFTLNDMPNPGEWKKLDYKSKKERISQMVTKDFEFLGVHYDLIHKTRNNTKKTIEKIDTLVNILKKREKITNRGVASIIGVYRYASEIVEYDMTARFDELRQLRRIISEGVTNIKAWDEECLNINYTGLITWGEELLPNIPVSIKKQRKEGEKSLIITDASA
eukprot:Tbor_TRINITY_DN6191_c0_g3::TRINITY_DN6191_c0_g3_i10::g.22347::m.22347